MHKAGDQHRPGSMKLLAIQLVLQITYGVTDMQSLGRTMHSVEYRDSRILAQQERDERLFEAGHEQGMAEAENDLADCARKCMTGAPEDEAENLRYFIARFVGYLDGYGYDKLSSAIRETSGVCKEEDNEHHD